MDAGGDVNRPGLGELPLFAAICSTIGDVEGRVRVLLAQPSLSLAVTNREGRTPEEVAIAKRRPGVAAMLRNEVRTRQLALQSPMTVLAVFAVAWLGVCALDCVSCLSEA